MARVPLRLKAKVIHFQRISQARWSSTQDSQSEDNTDNKKVISMPFNRRLRLLQMTDFFESTGSKCPEKSARLAHDALCEGDVDTAWGQLALLGGEFMSELSDEKASQLFDMLKKPRTHSMPPKNHMLSPDHMSRKKKVRFVRDE
jgi:hypothetical protein